MAKTNIPVGILAGIAGGLVASFVMNEFLARPGKALTEALEDPFDKTHREELSDGRDATMKTADALAVVATGGEHLTFAQQSAVGPVIHYAFGGLMGGLYGALAEVSPAARSGFGTTFGSMLFAGADLFAVPALHLGPSIEEEPATSLATPLAAHLIYGATTELIRRFVRRLV